VIAMARIPDSSRILARELAAPINSSPEPNARTFATITTSVAPDRWTFSSAVYTTAAADAVTLTAPLSSGGTGTTTVALPTVCDPARPCLPRPHANDRQ